MAIDGGFLILSPKEKNVEFLQKPFSLQELATTLRQILDEKAETAGSSR